MTDVFEGRACTLRSNLRIEFWDKNMEDNVKPDREVLCELQG